jgi:glycosyltransferase involved in cell wall biosynthesis
MSISPERADQRLRIVVATADTVAPQMAGPAIRAWHIARALSAEHEVRLLSTREAALTDPAFTIEYANDAALRDAVRWCDVFVFQGWMLAGRSFITVSDKVLVADVYDPMHLEQLEQGRDVDEDAYRAATVNTTAVLNEQLARGDFLMCASEKQRDFWLGQMSAVNRLNPLTYADDPTMRSLLTVVPFGISDDPPTRTGPGIRGVTPGVSEDDRVILWGGGIYNWFDPLTLVHAVDKLRVTVPNVRLVFMGLRHPNPEIPEMRMAVAARELSDELGLTGSHVFFNEGWVPYDQRQNHLLDADVGVSTHVMHVETEFSFRTRVLDYLWCGLPVVSTDGDSLSQLVRERELGVVVPPGDAAALRDALETTLLDADFVARCRANIAVVADELRWSKVLEPLLAFCRAPRRAPDLADPDMAAAIGGPRRGLVKTSGLLFDLRLVGRYLRQGGPRLLVERVRSRLDRRTADKQRQR